MSIMAAIDLAVRLQLLQDKPANYQDYNRVMGPAIGPTPGFDFDEAGMQVFLQKVSRRLRFDTPIVIYDWTKTEAAKCLSANRDVLIDLIAKDTSYAAGSTPPGANK